MSDAYVQVSMADAVTNNVGATDKALLGDVTATLAEDAIFVKASDTITITIAAADFEAGTTNIGASITAKISASDGTVGGNFASAAELIQASTAGWGANATDGEITCTEPAEEFFAGNLFYRPVFDGLARLLAEGTGGAEGAAGTESAADGEGAEGAAGRRGAAGRAAASQKRAKRARRAATSSSGGTSASSSRASST